MTMKKAPKEYEVKLQQLKYEHHLKHAPVWQEFLKAQQQLISDYSKILDPINHDFDKKLKQLKEQYQIQ